MSGQTGEEEAITAHQSPYLFDPATEKWPLLLLSTNSTVLEVSVCKEYSTLQVAFSVSRAAIM